MLALAAVLCLAACDPNRISEQEMRDAANDVFHKDRELGRKANVYTGTRVYEKPLSCEADGTCVFTVKSEGRVVQYKGRFVRLGDGRVVVSGGSLRFVRPEAKK